MPRPGDIVTTRATAPRRGRRYGGSVIPDAWMPHRRDDGEVVGFIEPAGDAFVPHDLLGRPLGAAVDWLDAERTLDELALAWLAEPVLARVDGDARPARRVRVVEVTRERVVVIDDEFGASAAVPSPGGGGDAGRHLQRWALPLPLEIAFEPVRASG